MNTNNLVEYIDFHCGLGHNFSKFCVIVWIFMLCITADGNVPLKKVMSDIKAVTGKLKVIRLKS